MANYKYHSIMKFIKTFIILSSIICAGCSQVSNDGTYNNISNRNSAVFLKIGETAKTGNLSQTIKRLEYVKFYSTSNQSDNYRCFELEYLLHSDYTSIIALNNYWSYSIVFDQNINNGTLESVAGPDSIAPKANEKVVIKAKCFKDWKTAEIKYSDNNGRKYSFSIRSSDYPDYTNNDYRTLNIGDSFVVDSGKYEVTLKSFTTTIIGSGYCPEKCDNIELVLTLNSLVDESINLPDGYSGYEIKADSDFSECRISMATPTHPSKLPARSSVVLKFIVQVEKTWKKIVFSNGSSSYKTYSFMLLHNEIDY